MVRTSSPKGRWWILQSCVLLREFHQPPEAGENPTHLTSNPRHVLGGARNFHTWTGILKLQMLRRMDKLGHRNRSQEYHPQFLETGHSLKPWEETHGSRSRDALNLLPYAKSQSRCLLTGDFDVPGSFRFESGMALKMRSVWVYTDANQVLAMVPALKMNQSGLKGGYPEGDIS